MNKVYYINCNDVYIQNNQKFLDDFEVIDLKKE